MRRSLLLIGEVATLLGVTRKTIRHYHKRGLLAEPERSEGGYRLYSAADVFALQRIRQLQCIGLSLQEIKDILCAEDADQLLHETLSTLKQELNEQISRLQARQTQIDSLLGEKPTLKAVITPDGIPAVLEAYHELFGHLMAELPPDAVEAERRVWASLDSLHWPVAYHEPVKSALREMAHRPGLQQHISELNQRYHELELLAPDDPAVIQLAHEVVNNNLFIMLDDQSLPMSEPFIKVFQEAVMQLVSDSASPSQRRFLELVRELAVKKAS